MKKRRQEKKQTISEAAKKFGRHAKLTLSKGVKDFKRNLDLDSKRYN